jgi:nucleoside 2-deoxyribosyltransferase
MWFHQCEQDLKLSRYIKSNDKHMKIYFAGSIRGGREDQQLYLSLIKHLKSYGEVLSEHIGDETLDSSGEKSDDNSWIHQRDMEWLISADVIVAEVTIPSLGVGYEIGRGIENQKPILCLYRKDAGYTLSAMIAGSPELTVVTYNDPSEAMDAIRSFMDKL